MSPAELVTLGTSIAFIFSTLLDSMTHPPIPELVPKRKLPHWLVEMLRKKYVVCPLLEHRIGDMLIASIVRYKLLEIILAVFAVLISNYMLFSSSDYLFLFNILAALTGTTIVNNFYSWVTYKVLTHYIYEISYQEDKHVNIQRVMT